MLNKGTSKVNNLLAKLFIGLCLVAMTLVITPNTTLAAEGIFLKNTSGWSHGSSGDSYGTHISERSSKTITYYNCVQIGNSTYNLQVNAYCSNTSSYSDMYMSDGCDSSREYHVPTVWIEYDSDEFDAHNDDYDDEYGDMEGTMQLTLKVVNSSGTPVAWEGYFAMNDIDGGEQWYIPFSSVYSVGSYVRRSGNYFSGTRTTTNGTDSNFAVIGYLSIPTSGATLIYDVDVDGGHSAPSGRTSTFACSGTNFLHTLTINPNGGKYNGTTAVTKIARPSGATYALGTPTRGEEYTYTWTKTGSWSGNTCTFTQDSTCTANWTLKQYDVTFNSNGGTPASYKKQTIVWGNKATNPGSPTRTGYRYGNWRIGSGNGTAFNFSTAVKQAYNLYAHWDANQYKVSYNACKLTTASDAISTTITGSMSTSDHVYDTAKPLNAIGYGLTGYKFAGWSLTNSGKTVKYTNQASVINLTTQHNVTVPLYTVWTPLQYTLSFNGNKPSNATHNVANVPGNRQVTFDAKIGAIATPSLIGWTLNKASNGNEWYIDSTSTSINKDTYYRYAGPKTAYAYGWTANKYTIYYDKGKTSDTTTTSVTGATRNTNLQSTNTDRPYTSATYDSNVTMASLDTSTKGTAYTIEFYANFPDSDSKGGAATEAIKKTYTVKQTVSTDGEQKATQTWTETASGDINTKWTLTGNLINAKTWTVTGCDKEGNGANTSQTVNQGATLTKPNFHAKNNASVVATANWLSTTIGTETYFTPSMKGYIFMGWYESPSYTITPNGSGGVNYTPATSKITSYKFDESTTAYVKKLYAHWKPIMVNLNTTYTNGQVVNDQHDGYLTKSYHLGKYYWEYAGSNGRSEASAFFTDNLNSYTRYASIPNPSLYFNIDLYTKTKVGTTTTTNYNILLPDKFVSTVFKFEQPQGTRDTLYEASYAARSWTRKEGVGITYNGLQNQANYRIYDVLNLKAWKYNGTVLTSTIKNAYNEDIIDKNFTYSYANLTETPNDEKTDTYTVDATWTQRDTDMKLPLPKRLLVINFNTEGGKKLEERLAQLDTDYYNDKQAKLRQLAEGHAVTYEDTGDSISNVYTPDTAIKADASKTLIYDFPFDGWYEKSTNKKYNPLDNIETLKNTEYYAKWNLSNKEIRLPQVEKDGYVFIGWYTKPQNIASANTGSNPSDAHQWEKYWAGAGYVEDTEEEGHLREKDDHLRVDECTTLDWDNATNNITLYAWFNRKPIFVDLYEGLFFEGQDVSYQDLKKLIGVFDFEDDYKNIALEYIEGLPSLGDENETFNALYLPRIEFHDRDFDIDRDYSPEDMLELRAIQIENYEFNSALWEPYNSEDWESYAETEHWKTLDHEGTADYDNLSSAEEGTTADIKNNNKPIKVVNGKLITPDGEYDGVYVNKDDGKIYYTDIAKEALASYLDPEQYDFAKKTGYKVKIKEIKYKVKDGQLEEDVVTPTSIYDDNVKDPRNYKNKKATTNSISAYTGQPVKGRDPAKDSYYQYKESKYRLDTGTDRVYCKGDSVDAWYGDFDVTYEVTDDGILFNGAVIADSPITLTYTRGCRIQYNQLPIIYTTTVADITDNNAYGADEAGYKKFADAILDIQTILDAEDNRSNNPWWSRKKTTPKLNNTLEITGIMNIEVDDTLCARYGVSNSDIDTLRATITPTDADALKKLYLNYKYGSGVNAKVWKCISSFDVIVDAHDQWGKYASGKVTMDENTVYGVKPTDEVHPEPNDPGEDPDPDPENPASPPETPRQTDEYRTISVILINTEEGLDVNTSNIMKNVRFIDEKYAESTISGNSYWSTEEGKNTLEEIFDNATNETLSEPPVESTYKNALGNDVKIHVEDYT